MQLFPKAGYIDHIIDEAFLVVKSFHVKLIEHSFKEVLIFKRHGTASEGNDL